MFTISDDERHEINYLIHKLGIHSDERGRAAGYLEQLLEMADNTLTFKQLQDENAEWQARNFPNSDPYYPLLGIMEEAGELAHHHLKQLQGIRGTDEEHIEGKRDAIGDITVYLSNYCTLNGLDFQSIVEEVWAEVRQRDWQANKMNGGLVSKVIYQRHD